MATMRTSAHTEPTENKFTPTIRDMNSAPISKSATGRRPVTAHSVGNGRTNKSKSDFVLDNDDGDNDDRSSKELKRVFSRSVKKSEAEDQRLPSKDQLTSALQQTGCNPSRRAVDAYWSDGQNEPISFSRFCDIVNKERTTANDDTAPLNAFRKFDPENTGKIARKKLWILMTTKGERMDDDEFSRIFDQSKFMTDGNFDYVAYCHVVKKTSRNCKGKANKTPTSDEASRDNGNDYKKNIKRRERPKTCQSYFTSSVSNGNTCDSSDSSCKPIWPRWQSKGNFHVDDDGNIVSHQYTLELPVSSDVFLTIEPLLPQNRKLDGVPADCLIYILRESDSGSSRQLASFTENRDDKGLYYRGTNLSAGRYTLQPFTSGCLFMKDEPEDKSRQIHSPSNGPNLSKLLIHHSSSSDGLQLSDEYEKVLKEIFDVADLDGNRRLSRQEFSLLQWQSCGEEVHDDEWKALEDNFEMESGELNLKGFLDVHLLEAENNEGNDIDLWKTLHAMGYDDDLKLVNMCPFLVTVYTEESGCKFRISAMKSGGSTLEKAVCRSLIEIGTAKKVRNLNDLILYSYIGPHRAVIAVQNKSHSSVSVRLDCTWSQNCISHRGKLDYILQVPPKNMKVGHYLLPQSDTEPWKVVCNESVVKLQAS